VIGASDRSLYDSPMRLWAVAAFLLATSSALAQAQHRASQEVTFISSDGAFRFDYPETLVLCQRDPKQSNSWTPNEPCNGFTPVCTDVSCKAQGTLACIAYPTAGMMKGTNFEAAAFSVSELKDSNTESNCRIVAEPPPQESFHTETINGTRFDVTEVDGVATGSLLHGYVYRSFHNRKCYELDIRVTFSSLGSYAPGAVKNFDSEKVQRALKDVLESFEFLK
jgi:hypothetical protein